MSAATLLNPSDPAFAFDHRKAHEGMLITTAELASSSIFSGLPYWIDPPFGDTAVPSGWANTLHAVAHGDFIGLFEPPYGGTGRAGVNDIALQPEPLSWAQFNNFQLHYIANQTF